MKKKILVIILALVFVFLAGRIISNAMRPTEIIPIIHNLDYNFHYYHPSENDEGMIEVSYRQAFLIINPPHTENELTKLIEDYIMENGYLEPPSPPKNLWDVEDLLIGQDPLTGENLWADKESVVTYIDLRFYKESLKTPYWWTERPANNYRPSEQFSERWTDRIGIVNYTIGDEPSFHMKVYPESTYNSFWDLLFNKN